MQSLVAKGWARAGVLALLCLLRAIDGQAQVGADSLTRMEPGDTLRPPAVPGEPQDSTPADTTAPAPVPTSTPACEPRHAGRGHDAQPRLQRSAPGNARPWPSRRRLPSRDDEARGHRSRAGGRRHHRRHERHGRGVRGSPAGRWPAAGGRRSADQAGSGDARDPDTLSRSASSVSSRRRAGTRAARHRCRQDARLDRRGPRLRRVRNALRARRAPRPTTLQRLLYLPEQLSVGERLREKPHPQIVEPSLAQHLRGVRGHVEQAK